MGCFIENSYCRFLEVQDADTREKLGYLDLPFNEKLGYVVPHNISLTQILNSATCRHFGRFPTLSYVHKKSGNSMWKCAELKRESLNKAELMDDIAVLD